MEAEGEAAEEEDDDDDGLDLPQLSPPPALQSPHPALLSPQPVATPVTPAVAAIQVRPARFPALSDTAAAALHPPTRSTHHGISLPALLRPMRWQPDLLDFTLPPTPSAITPVGTTSENWVAEMESEIQEFDQLTAQHGMPNSAPGGAGWKQSMEEELELHLSKT